MTRASVQSCAYHEAGHAFARWWLGFMTDKITVLTFDQIRAGGIIEDRRGRERSGLAGAVDGCDIHIPFARQIVDGECPDDHRALLLRQAPRRAEASMIMTFAGPLAEARFRRCSAWTTYFFGGEQDMRSVTEISRDWFGSDDARAPFVNRAEKLARALVRSPKAETALTLIATELGAGGVMDGERIEALCAEAYGGAELVFDRWADTWPPTLKQIREGYLPVRAS